MISSYGSYFGVGALGLLYGIFEAFSRRRVVGPNPWGEGATTLEWQLPSPPPFHQWEELPRSGDLGMAQANSVTAIPLLSCPDLDQTWSGASIRKWLRCHDRTGMDCGVKPGNDDVEVGREVQGLANCR